MSKNLLRIIVPVAMLLGIFAIWKIQENNKPQEVASVKDTPFALRASSIDLEALKKLNLPIIIDFGADSCIPCKEMAPVLIKLNAEMQNKAIVKFVDVWKHPEGATGFPVQVIPTQIFINADGTPYIPKQVSDVQFTKYSTKETQEHKFTAHQGGLTEQQMRNILSDMGVK